MELVGWPGKAAHPSVDNSTEDLQWTADKGSLREAACLVSADANAHAEHSEIILRAAASVATCADALSS